MTFEETLRTPPLLGEQIVCPIRGFWNRDRGRFAHVVPMFDFGVSLAHAMWRVLVFLGKLQLIGWNGVCDSSAADVLPLWLRSKYCY